jgi:hypothetical protein
VLPRLADAYLLFRVVSTRAIRDGKSAVADFAEDFVLAEFDYRWVHDNLRVRN